MAARPTWKGTLKISLVTIPIKVFPATDTSAVLDFHQLHEPCRTRISQKRWCGTCQKEVPYAEIVKGHEFEKDKYVVLSETEFAAVKPESAKTINLTRVAAAATLDPLYIDRSYYLGPDGDRAGEPFAVLSAALRGQVGIGKLAIYGREYLVAVRPAADGAVLVLHTLHHAAEIRSAADLIADVPATVSPSQVKLAKQLLATFTSPRQQGLPLAAFTDDYQRDLKALIAKKIAGEEIIEATAPPETSSSTVVSLKDALTRSLQLVRGGKKTPAKVSLNPKATRKRA